VVEEIGAFLVERADVARAAGVDDASLMVDPGIGFGKTVDHNLTLLAELPRLVAQVGLPVLVGTSRKGFIGRLLGIDEPEARDDGTLATTVWALDQGARMVRVHDVRGAVRSAALLDVLTEAAA
jgi:dihydropteroate synthase